VEPLGANTIGQLPAFNRAVDVSYFIDVYNQGEGELSWTAKASAAWIKLSQTRGQGDARILVSIDWPQVPNGSTVPGSITITGAGSGRTINLTASNPEGVDWEALPDAVENNGVVTIAANNFNAREDSADGTGWRRVDQATATGDGMTIQPVTARSANLA